MRHLRSAAVWLVVIGIGWTLSAAKLIEADPTDDFSFTWVHPPETGAYRVMSEARVVHVFSDRLQGVERSRIGPLAWEFIHLCREYRFDPAFVLALIQVESGFRLRATSPMGAIGLMQLMPATASVIARETGIRLQSPQELYDPFVNLRLGIAYLGKLRDRYQGVSPYYLVAAYNLGPARLERLMARPTFRPTGTKVYYDRIRRGVPGLRFYKRSASGSRRASSRV